MQAFDLEKSVVKLCLLVFFVMMLLGVLLHFCSLDKIPYGFHVDEMSGSVAIGCLASEGVDAHNVRYPLFADLNYGTPKPPTYLYPALVWVKIFGYSVPSLRALSVTVHIVGIAGLFFLAHFLFGWRYAVLTVAVAVFSPWAWVLSRVAFESLFAVTFLIWGLYVFLRASRPWAMVLAAVLLAGAMYSYPPIRLQTPLILLPLIIYSRMKYRLSWKSLAVFSIVFIILLIPLAQKIITSHSLLQRFNQISIFSPDYLRSIGSNGNWIQLMQIFGYVYVLHFNPNFLFFKGDLSYVHSTRHFGILSWMDMAGLGIGLVFLVMLLFKPGRKDNPLLVHGHWLIFLIVGVLIGVVPVAFTSSEIPNSLRIMGAWPFICLLTGFFLWQACERWWGMWLVTVLITALFAFAFLKVYFQVYPKESKGMFGYWTLEEANQLKTDDDWLKFVLLYRHDDYNARYFLMQYRGLTCTQSRTLWERLRDFLLSRGKY